MCKKNLTAWLSTWVILTPDQRWLLLLSIAAIALWTIGLGNLPLRDWDEGTYAIVTREMARNQNWWFPMQFGQPYFMKPPVIYWLVALGTGLFGQMSEFALRLPLALPTALGVPLLYSFTRELTPRRRDAVLTAGVYLTLLPVVRHGRLLMLDGLVNSLLILLLWCLLRSRQSPPWALGMGLCLGAIALTKGILVFALWGIVGVYMLLDRQWAALRNPYTWLGVALGMGCVAVWYVSQWQQYGEIFVQVHLGTQNFARIATAVEGNAGPLWYYLLEIIKYGFPWLLFWPGGLWLAWQGRQTSRGRLILTVTLLFLTTISLMGTKLPWYVMPIYPFMALAVGWQLSEAQDHLGRWLRGLRWLLGLIALVGLGGMVYFALTDPQVPLILLAFVLAITMAMVAWQLQQRDRRFVPTLLIGIYACLACLMLSSVWIWELNEAFPVQGVAQMIEQHTPAGQRVFTSFDYNRPSLDFYSDRHVFPISNPVQLAQFRADGHYLLLDAAGLERLAISSDAILSSTEGFSIVKPELE
ncbi:MAG: glycosyltransferase family 39 protein [Spirulina sp. SIO3F2]|nr:glycosyltransferase family 39 protein [Spirulina sp. SIO3F2]